MLTVLVDGYAEEQLAREQRVVLSSIRALAPIKAAVLPLLRNRPELVERARLTPDLKAAVPAAYDDTASIGKLYRRQDEIGTPSASRSTPRRWTTARPPSASATR